MRLPILFLPLALLASASHAADIAVVGLFPGKAVLVVDGGTPKTFAVGSIVTPGVKLLTATESSATVIVNDKKQTIAIGQHVNRSAPTGPTSVVLQANGQGHFMVQGQINGGAIQMLVDTGATMIAFSEADAQRLGINYKAGQPGRVNTANGSVPVYRVKLDTVKVGSIELNQVDAVVQQAGLPFALLGMSFLNRMEMRRDGEHMTLTKRF
ncbi:TIGR02281 family clan AA aspartic protease [Herminiimonas sp. CN]|uniref:retropepsin-like aspartic protease family protein n=1 Tax=Herminiimonas sp. CN TaxID=1349818 RepID=UPI000473A2DA|nr:TIGR02281 family clan AA aspartic protease [Herminiimonas sp. CN]